MTKHIQPIKNIKTLQADYLTVTEEDDDKMLRLKEIVADLNLVDKTIFLLYIKHASMRKVAKELNVSLTTACKKINTIQLNIINQLEQSNVD